MSERQLYSPIRIEDDRIIIESPPSEAKDEFFRLMEERVVILSKDEYYRHVKPTSSLGHFDAFFDKTPSGKTVGEVSILINKDDFYVDGQDFTDLIPLCIRHEIIELWVFGKTGFSLSHPREGLTFEQRRDIAHSLALIGEFEYAFETGKADRHLHFITQWAESTQTEDRKNRIVNENIQAYQRARKRYENRRSKDL